MNEINRLLLENMKLKNELRQKTERLEAAEDVLQEILIRSAAAETCDEEGRRHHWDVICRVATPFLKGGFDLEEVVKLATELKGDQI